VSEIVVNVTDPGSYAISVDGATPTTATVSNGGSVTVSVPDVTIGDIAGLAAELAGKADAVHDHVMADITDLAFPVTSVNGQTGDVVIEAGGGGGGALLSDAEPQPLGVANAGDAVDAARADHVHAMPTAADVGALAESAQIDGGYYTGVIILPTQGIAITSQPASQTTIVGGVSELSSSLPAGTWGPIARVNGQWIVSGYQSGQADYVAVSNDGINWQKRFGLPSAGLWSAVQFENGIYATQSLNTVASSFDAETWPEVSTISFSSGSVFAAGGKFVRATQSHLYASEDASEWTQGTAWSRSATLSFGYANQTFFAADYSAGILASADGITWASPTGASVGVGVMGENGRAIVPAVFNGAVYIGSNTKRPVRYENGTWASVSGSGPTASGGQIATNGDVLVYLDHGFDSQTATRVYTSTTGTSWVQRSLPLAIPGQNRATLFYAGGRFVILMRTDPVNTLAPSSKIYFTSANGIDWVQGERQFPTFASGSQYRYFDSTVFANTGDGLFNTISFGETTASATFSVVATYTGSLAYQWQQSLDGGATWSDMSGETSSSLALIGLTTADSGKRYRCVISAVGTATVTSTSATLTVN
jgi:hypothetical protein